MSSLLFLLLLPSEDYLNQHSFDEASRYYRVFSSIAPSYDAGYGSAICALTNGQLAKSIELFQSIPSKKPKAFYYLGVAYYQLGRYEQASRYFDFFIGEKEKLWQLNYYLSLINLKQHKITDAIKYLHLTPDSNDKAWLLEYIADYTKLVDAQKKFIAGNYNGAVDLYEKIENFFGYKEIGLALTCSKIGEYEKSLALLDTVINNSDDRQLVARSMIEAGLVSFISNDFLKARFYVKKYLEITSDDKALFLLGQIFSDEAQYDSATFYFKILPDSVDEYLFYKGRTNYFLGLWGNAEEQLLIHREIYPNSMYGDRAVYIIASINAKRKEYDQAINFWNELLTHYPNSVYAAAALEGIGDAYFNMEKYTNALNAFREVKEYNPSPSIKTTTILKIYETFYYLGKYSSLVEALRSFIENNQNSKLVPKIYLRISKILSKRGSLYQSLSELDKIIYDYPELSISNDAIIEKARIYEQLGKKRAMIKSYQHLLTKQRAEEYHAYAANELGSIYLKESRYDSALYYYNLLLDYDKYRERAMFEIAGIYHELEQNKGSETMIDKLISEYPSSVFLLDAYVLKSKVYKNQGNYQKAINLLHELMKKVGQKPEIFIEIGNIYFELEQYPDARENYLTAAEYFKQERDDAAQALILAGDASIAIDDTKNALEYYLQANLIARTLTMKHRAAERISKISEE